MVIAACQMDQATGRGCIERSVIEGSSRKRLSAETAGPNTMNGDAAGVLNRGEDCAWIVVQQTARDDVHVVVKLGQVKGQIGKELAGGRVIGIKVAVDEDQLYAIHLLQSASWGRPSNGHRLIGAGRATP